MCRDCQLEAPEAIIPQIARGFAGGIGNSGAVCGAVAGGVMAIGLSQGRSDNLADALDELKVAGDFRRRFEAKMGSINCRELTGADLTTEEGIEAFMRSDTPEKVCFPAVSTAYQLVLDILAESAERDATG